MRPTEPENQPNYTLALAMYLRGVELRDIAPKVNASIGALRRYSIRHGWNQLRTQAGALVSQSAELTPTKQGEKPLTSPEHTIRRTLKSRLDGLAESLPSKLPRDPKSMQQVASAALSLVHAGQTAEGWIGPVNTALDIHILGSAPSDLLVHPPDGPKQLESGQESDGSEQAQEPFTVIP